MPGRTQQLRLGKEISMEKKQWLQTHLEEFVRPRVGNVELTPLEYFSRSEMTIIKNLWRSAKKAAGDRTMVLPGRDVFVFEVLARRENYPTIFWPDCSRQTVRRFSELLPPKAFIFDTGFMGSIPNALGVENFSLVSASERGSFKQTFPRLTLSRALALKIEATPKYWKTGIIFDGELMQEQSDTEQFTRAARLTLAIYKDSSPAFINESRPLKKGDYLWSQKIF